jgi:hypothetical protein
MKKIIAFLSVLLISIFTGITFDCLFGINPLISGAASFVISYIPLPGGSSLYSLLFTAAGGVGTPFAFQFKGLHQFLTWDDAGNPIDDLRVETQEDGVLHNFVALSLAAMNGFMVQGAIPANNLIMRFASGFIKDKNVTISGHTSAVGAIDFYASSDNAGVYDQQGKYRLYPYKTQNATILALEPTTFSDFTALFIPAMAAGDTCEVVYNNGHRQLFNIQDLTNLSTVYQGVPGIIVNNVNANIHTAQFQCAAEHPVYVMKVNI